MRMIAVIVVASVALALVFTCTYVVDETQFAIVKRFGQPVQTALDPGLRLKWPWPVDTVVRFDNRVMVLENPRAGEPEKEYITLDREIGIGKNVEVGTYTCWRIQEDRDAVLRFLETMGDRESAEARLGDVVVSELGAALGQYDFSELVSTNPENRKWTPMLDAIFDRCRQRVQEYGIEIVDVKIQRLNFPDQNRRNVFDRMRAERQRIATRYRSEGEEKATGIRARANRQREEILANAYMEAERTRGEGDADAARIYAEAYSQDSDFYEFLRTLQSYERTLDQNAVLILSADSEFLRLLNKAAEAPASGDDSVPMSDHHESPRSSTQPADRQ